jgi:hypothetical protein
MQINKLWHYLTRIFEGKKQRRKSTVGLRAIQYIKKGYPNEPEEEKKLRYKFFSILVQNDIQFDMAGFGIIVVKEDIFDNVKKLLEGNNFYKNDHWKEIPVASYSKTEKDDPEFAELIRKNRFRKSIPT